MVQPEKNTADLVGNSDPSENHTILTSKVESSGDVLPVSKQGDSIVGIPPVSGIENSAAESASTNASHAVQQSSSQPPEGPPNVADTTAPLNSNEQEIIEAEDNSSLEGRNDDDVDSAYGDDTRSITDSLPSAITKYRYENGRRYHAYEDGRYFLPNDEQENDRLDLFHHLLTLRTEGRLHLAPIGPNPQRILDLGTGTGIWAIEMGDAYPSAEVLGNDLSPIQPAMVPPNVTFEVDDIENNWVYSRQFDYIHSRYLAGSISDWPRLVAQAFEFVKPGGWVEFQDFDMKFYSTDGTFVPGSSPDIWTKEVAESLKVFGKVPEPGPMLEQWVREAGFENIVHQVFPIPVGMWPKDKIMKEIGACDLSMFLEGLEGISLRAFTNSGRGWTPEGVLAFLPGVRKDLCNRRIHALHNFHIVYAQKPMS